MQCYPVHMRPEQKVIAGWIERIRQKHRINWRQWAARIKETDGQGPSDTTLSRAVKEDFDSVTSITTLDQMARALGEKSVLDFLRGDSLVSAERLRPILSTSLRHAPKIWSEQDVERLARAIEYGLGLVKVDPANPASQDAIEVAAQAAADRFREGAPTS